MLTEMPWLLCDSNERRMEVSPTASFSSSDHDSLPADGRSHEMQMTLALSEKYRRREYALRVPSCTVS
jgi:hypothetical protein